MQKCEVSIDLNALEISIEQSSVLAVLKLFENVLGTEDDSSVGCHQDSLNQPHSVVTAGGSIKTPPQTLTSTTLNALLGRVLARLRSVRVNLGLITVYLIQRKYIHTSSHIAFAFVVAYCSYRALNHCTPYNPTLFLSPSETYTTPRSDGSIS